MNELTLLDTQRFGEIQCDFYSDGTEMYMTREQVGAALEYAYPQESIQKIHERHPERLGKYSVQVKLTSTDGKAYDTTLYNRKGVMEVCRHSKQPKADAFMDWVWEIMDALISGKTHPALLPQDYPSALRALADEAEKRMVLEGEVAVQRQIIADYEPKVQYLDLILGSKESMTVTQIAADYGMSARRLNKILHEERVQRCVNGQWVLYTEHMGLGYTRSKLTPIERRNGTMDYKPNTEWTQKGRLYIHELLKKRGILAVVDRETAGEQIAI